ncbi:MAG: N5-carboxyaminoimidazole ribonucleotide mutase [Halanaerobium sp. 4-GBenrich]|jgi:5-(carboxyamino)imidazole ribonucleotide mutase|uniref:N5-carboxyaminoimidazole ribonucleotide mutase n=1 Tax=Halanaerobium congolense TaxID=54121 RepID=A0A1G6JT56_9FIRM|nr:5-(carboxyamino)imidazole ribonucleotide mutase [Halanaerobium congolense]KXS49038.1 MAG: N5-carboxyaminoimidazole ribonucleotide mutase [Halanaerobium sp. T82-1]ODS50698.1 MAG: N5-carboxyaminoimidazole ribonucleotide mutase [Halanaerobium sp. 4-GBenrich]PUU91328.1 MAG: N5-carboxyaminoimidazole ribonucleotide mutase [Halanaerobium sp.]PTX16142.1 5-(carboxyamino)imidazole ribonucleotide mutase [Halanaerobium congolense]PXV65170.1 5-(carboxyamino)imidazole ribonucleotide mutase [Halanaerobium
MKPRVGVVMGSDSDLPVMKETAEILDQFEVKYELTVVSAHRTPDRLYNYAETAEKKGLDVIIAGAGGAAHLPGMVAALTTVPVIGVPVKTSKLSGLDSLYSIVQMPPGVPVATVAINGAKNAALLAVQILARSDEELNKKQKKYRQEMKAKVLKTAAELKDMGYQEYLERSEKFAD